MSRNPSDSAVKAWARLVRARETLFAAIERDLKAAGCPPLAWYDVLLELVRAPEGRLRPIEIAKETLLAQYNLSRLLDRLEKESLVSRAPHEGDARGQWVVITEKGRAVQARTWKVYARSIQKHVGEKLDDKAAETLAALLGRLIGQARHGRSAARVLP
jgi:DNA-binding MarR family transcriptional regulator